MVGIKTGTVFGHFIAIFQDIGYALPIRDIFQQIKSSKGFEAASFDFPSPYDELANAFCALPAIPGAEKLTEEALVPQVRRQSRQSRAVQALDRVSDPFGILDKSTRKYFMGIIIRFGADFPSHKNEMETTSLYLKPSSKTVTHDGSEKHLPSQNTEARQPLLATIASLAWRPRQIRTCHRTTVLNVVEVIEIPAHGTWHNELALATAYPVHGTRNP